MSIPRFGRKISAILQIHAELPLTAQERTDYIKNLCILRSSEERRFLFEHLYMNLDVLDNKTNTMVQFVSILVAVYSATAGYFINATHHSLTLMNILMLGSVAAGVCLSFSAAVLFLSIEKVHWSTADELADADRHANRLVEVRTKRTIRYRWGWWFAIISLFLLILLVPLAAVR